jgi:hypothetical protein
MEKCQGHKPVAAIIAAIVMIFAGTNCSFAAEKLPAKDSIEIINPKMSYHMKYYVNSFKHELEPISYNYYKYNNFKHLFDSLSTIYTPFKFRIKFRSPDEGNFVFFFLVDSCTQYFLQIFIPPNTLSYRELNDNKYIDKLFKLKKYGILAFKLDYCKEVEKKLSMAPEKEWLRDDVIYREYKQLLKSKKIRKKPIK